MHLLLGEWLPRPQHPTLADRIRSGHEWLVRITGEDFGYDPERWHEYLRETDDGGYRWSNKHLKMPRRIAEALSNPAWRQAVAELQANG